VSDSGHLPLDYEMLPGFEDLYLEGSFVLDIVEDEGWVKFVLNAALRPRHPHYERPPAAQAHCYRRLQVTFRELRKTTWFARSELVYTDADGRKDHGCIDSFTAEPDGSYVLEGDWGGVAIESASPTVQLVGRLPEIWVRRRIALDAWLDGTPREKEDRT
jgi:hypothetical protein